MLAISAAFTMRVQVPSVKERQPFTARKQAIKNEVSKVCHSLDFTLLPRSSMSQVQPPKRNNADDDKGSTYDRKMQNAKAIYWCCYANACYCSSRREGS